MGCFAIAWERSAPCSTSAAKFSTTVAAPPFCWSLMVRNARSSASPELKRVANCRVITAKDFVLITAAPMDKEREKPLFFAFAAEPAGAVFPTAGGACFFALVSAKSERVRPRSLRAAIAACNPAASTIPEIIFPFSSNPLYLKVPMFKCREW